MNLAECWILAELSVSTNRVGSAQLPLAVPHILRSFSLGNMKSPGTCTDGRASADKLSAPLRGLRHSLVSPVGNTSVDSAQLVVLLLQGEKRESWGRDICRKRGRLHGIRGFERCTG